MKNLRFVVLLLTLFVACSKAPVSQSVDAGAIPHVGAINPVYSGDFSIYPGSISATSLAIKDSTAVTRDTIDLTHGRITFGGGGTDFKVVCGPLTGFETANAGCFFGAGATTPSSANVGIYGDGLSTFINAPSAISGVIDFVLAGSTVTAKLDAINGRLYLGGSTTSSPIFFDWSTAATPFLQSGTGTSFSLKDSTAVARDSFEMTHGRATFGGGGSDTKATLGPYVGNETTLSALYLLTNAQTTASGPVLYSDGSSLYAIPISSSGEFRVSPGGTAAFDVSGNVLQAAFGGITGGTSPLFVDWSTATTPFIRSGTSATSLRMGTNNVGATFSLQADAAVNVVQLAGGTQNSIALGSNLATTGHIRSPTGVQWLARNGANTANVSLVTMDTSSSIAFGDTSNTGNTSIFGTGTVTLHTNASAGGSPSVDLDGANGVGFGDGTFNNGMIGTFPHTGANTLIVQPTVTSFGISWVTAAGVASPTSLTGQNAGGSGNDGGPLTLAGGAHAGAGTAVDGSVKITTPLNAGVATVSASVPTNLTNAQSSANVLLLTGALGGPTTVNVLRRISDTSLMFIRNITGVTLTIAYLTGGTITIATGTSALICSDGTNLQKIINGT